MKRKIEKLKKYIERGKKEKMMMIGGDFNARTGIQKRRLGVEKEEEREKRSKDKKTNKEGWKLLEAIGKVGMKILNKSGRRRGGRVYVYRRDGRDGN